MPSLTYHLTLLVIKLKGIKKAFSKDPIDVKALRKEDMRAPKSSFFNGQGVRTFQVEDTKVTEKKPINGNGQLLILIHGGGFISGPAKHHWDSLKTMIKQSGVTGWLCDYPKAPEVKIDVTSQNIDAIYGKALEEYAGENITLIGDSVGGTLITALTQRLVKAGKSLPKQIILLSPVMDATMSNPDIKAIEDEDPMVAPVGIVSAKRMAAGNLELDHPMISPIYGDFKGFPPTILFAGSIDVTYPDQILVANKLKASGAEVELIDGHMMPHIWPFLPVMKEAKQALNVIINRLS